MDRRFAAALSGALIGLVALATVAVGACLWRVGPYIRDDLALDASVQLVSLTWQQEGRSAAEQQLEYAIDAHGMGPWISDDACRLGEGEKGRFVRCVWSVEVQLPGTQVVIPLDFQSEASVTEP